MARKWEQAEKVNANHPIPVLAPICWNSKKIIPNPENVCRVMVDSGARELKIRNALGRSEDAAPGEEVRLHGWPETPKLSRSAIAILVILVYMVSEAPKMTNTDLLLFSFSPLSFVAFVVLPAIFGLFFSLRLPSRGTARSQH